MDAVQESGWEVLRKNARKIEGDLDAKLSSYAKLGANLTQGDYLYAGSPSVDSSRTWKSTEMEINSLIEKLLHINDSECWRIKGNIRGHSESLSSVRDDTTEYKIDDVSSQAQATRAVLSSQRTLFGDVRGKVEQLGDKFPVRLEENVRKTLILSGVIAA